MREVSKGSTRVAILSVKQGGEGQGRLLSREKWLCDTLEGQQGAWEDVEGGTCIGKGLELGPYRVPEAALQIWAGRSGTA